MRRSVKLGLTALAAAVLLSSMVAAASAQTLQTTEQSFRVLWSSLEFASEIVTIRCRVTLEGSFHTRTIRKVERSLIGAITRAIVAHPCTNGEAWADNGTERAPLGTLANRLPFHVTYENFVGRLPNIEAIGLLLSRVSFVNEASFFGIACRGRYGRPEDNISGQAAREARGGVNRLVPVERRNIANLVTDLSPGLRACPATGSFRGTGEVFSLSAGTRISVTLI